MRSWWVRPVSGYRSSRESRSLRRERTQARRRLADHDGLVFFLDLFFFELPAQVDPGAAGLGDEQQAARRSVEPVDGDGPRQGVRMRRRSEVMAQGILHGAKAIAAGRYAGRLVDQGEVIVFVDRLQFHFVGLRRRFFQIDQLDALAGTHPLAGGSRLPVDPHFVLFDSLFDPFARRKGREDTAGVVAEASRRRVFGNDVCMENLHNRERRAIRPGFPGRPDLCDDRRLFFP